MRFDGSAVLRKILDNPDVFRIESDAEEMARKVATAQMKAIADISGLRRLCATLGVDDFKMVADGISDTQAKSIVGKIDKDNKEAKTAGGPAQRVLLVELATGTIEPRAKDIKAQAAKSVGKKSQSSAKKAIKATSTKASRTKTTT